MLKTIKWELLKSYYRLRWIVLFALAAVGIFAGLASMGAFKSSSLINDYFLNGLSFLFLALILLFCILIPPVNMLIDYLFPHKYLERTIGHKQKTVIWAKLITNGMIFYIGAAISLLVNLIFKKFIPNGTKYFGISGDMGIHIFLYMMFGIIMPVIVLFFYMLTYCVKAEVKHRILLMTVFIVIAFGALFLMSKVVFLSKIFKLGIMIGIILIVTNVSMIIENRYEPK